MRARDLLADARPDLLEVGSRNSWLAGWQATPADQLLTTEQR